MKFLAPTLTFLLFFGCQRSNHEAHQSLDSKEVADITVTGAATDAQAMNCAGKDKSSCKGSEESGGCAQWDEAAAEVAKRGIPADAHWETLSVTGMTCGGCERRVVANVGEVEGILAVEADAELGQVRVATKENKKELKVAAIEKIKSLGYSIQ